MLPPDAKVQRTDAAPVEPLSLVEAKLYCRVETGYEDALFLDLITAARLKCEQIADASLTAASYRLTCDYLPYGGLFGFLDSRQSFPAAWQQAGVIELPNPPLVAVTAIKYAGMDGQQHTLDPATYRVSPGTPGQVQPAFGTFWPFQLPEIAAVEVDYTAGIDPTKLAAAKQAMRILVAHSYTTRGTDAPVPQAVEYILGPARNYGYS